MSKNRVSLLGVHIEAQLTFTCSKSAKTLEKYVKYVQSLQ